MIRTLLWITAGSLLLLYLLFRFGPALMGFEKTPQQSRAYFQNLGLSPTFGTLETQGRKIHYVDTGGDSLPTVIFIHGSPGSWDAFQRYLGDSLLLSKFRMIAVDRLGYGQSDPQPESSLAIQAGSLLPLLGTVPDGVPVILVGHSYGGPVAYRMAMEQPECIDGLLILAGLADPAKEKRLWIQKPLRSKWLRWLLPPALDISNREIVPLKGELQQMVPLWPRIQACTTIIQGGRDMLVNKAHAEFARNMLHHVPLRYVYLPKANHFLPWTHYELVKNELLNLLQWCPSLSGH